MSDAGEVIQFAAAGAAVLIGVAQIVGSIKQQISTDILKRIERLEELPTQVTEIKVSQKHIGEMVTAIFNHQFRQQSSPNHPTALGD